MIMNLSKKLMLTVFSAFILVGCEQKKINQEVSPSQPEELTPAEKENLTLPQQEKLLQDEDNVMNPIPG